MTKERPILFTGDMVRAVLDGGKTQTRRVLKGDFMHQPKGSIDAKWYFRGPKMACWDSYETDAEMIARHNPYGQPGDRFWVRESHAPRADCGCVWDRSKAQAFNRMQPGELCYAADQKGTDWVEKWRPGIHMFRWASRITLEIVSVRVERLQDISEADAIAEGIHSQGGGLYELHHFDVAKKRVIDSTQSPVLAYRGIWESINGPDTWALNPWVWVIEFKRIKP